MEPRITLVTLGVRDLGRSVAFYERLGFPRAVRDAEGVAFFRLGPVVLSLFPRADLAGDAGVPPEGDGFRAVALAHNVRDRDAVKDVLAEAEAAGARIVRPAGDAPWGGRFGYFADPDGHLWEVAWNPGFPLGADGTPRLPD